MKQSIYLYMVFLTPCWTLPQTGAAKVYTLLRPRFHLSFVHAGSRFNWKYSTCFHFSWSWVRLPKSCFDVTCRRRQRKTSTLRMRLRLAFQIASVNRSLLKLCIIEERWFYLFEPELKMCTERRSYSKQQFLDRRLFHLLWLFLQ